MLPRGHPDRKINHLEKELKHGSRFAQTVLRNATMLRLQAPHGTAQVKRLRQDKLDWIWNGPSQKTPSNLTRMSHKFSTALRNTGADADFVGFASLQGVDPASPANLHKTRASTRSPFARYEFCETCGLKTGREA